jgi:hypothetical protein
MATSFHRNARCPHIGLKEGGEDVMLTGGLLPFPRTGCVLYAKATLSYCAEIRQVRTREIWELEDVKKSKSTTESTEKEED